MFVYHLSRPGRLSEVERCAFQGRDLTSCRFPQKRPTRLSPRMRQRPPEWSGASPPGSTTRTLLRTLRTGQSSGTSRCWTRTPGRCCTGSASEQLCFGYLLTSDLFNWSLPASFDGFPSICPLASSIRSWDETSLIRLLNKIFNVPFVSSIYWDWYEAHPFCRHLSDQLVICFRS